MEYKRKPHTFECKHVTYQLPNQELFDKDPEAWFVQRHPDAPESFSKLGAKIIRKVKEEIKTEKESLVKRRRTRSR